MLVLIAGASLLFTGRYPQQLLDLAMGIERWTYRVAAYTSLMTGDYRPFRLDVEEGGSPRASAIAFP